MRSSARALSVIYSGHLLTTPLPYYRAADRRWILRLASRSMHTVSALSMGCTGRYKLSYTCRKRARGPALPSVLFAYHLFFCAGEFLLVIVASQLRNRPPAATHAVVQLCHLLHSASAHGAPRKPPTRQHYRLQHYVSLRCLYRRCRHRHRHRPRMWKRRRFGVNFRGRNKSRRGGSSSGGAGGCR